MKIRRLTLLSLGFVLIFNILFYQSQIGLWLGLFFLLLNTYFYLLKDNRKNSWLGIAASITASLFAFLIAWRSNGVVQFINFLSALSFSALALYFYNLQSAFVPRLVNLLLVPWEIAWGSLKNSLALFSDEGRKGLGFKSQAVASVLRGSVISLPILLILFILFTRADPIFGKLSQNFFIDFGNRAIVSTFLFVAVFLLALNRFQQVIEEAVSPVKSVRLEELAVILGSVVTLLTIFIIVQINYLFVRADERQLQELGINVLTYSEYVRKGFFELLIASVITSWVVIYLLHYLHRLTGIKKMIYQILGAVLTLETGLLLLSASQRLFFYTDAHGLTRMRILGFIFLLWLTALLLMFLVRVIKQFAPKWSLTWVMAIILMALLAVNLVNIDNLIAQRYPPTVNGEIDYYYLASLSPDAAWVWPNIVQQAETQIVQLEKQSRLSDEDQRKLFWTRLTLNKLKTQLGYLKEKYDSEEGKKWQAINLTEINAYQQLVQRKLLEKDVDDLINRSQELQPVEIERGFRGASLDRTTQPPLVR